MDCPGGYIVFVLPDSRGGWSLFYCPGGYIVFVSREVIHVD